MGKSQGSPLLAAGGKGPASPANGCVKPGLAFPLESPLDEFGGTSSRNEIEELSLCSPVEIHENKLILGVNVLPPDLRGASLGAVATLTKAK